MKHTTLFCAFLALSCSAAPTVTTEPDPSGAPVVEPEPAPAAGVPLAPIATSPSLPAEPAEPAEAKPLPTPAEPALPVAREKQLLLAELMAAVKAWTGKLEGERVEQERKAEKATAKTVGILTAKQTALVELINEIAQPRSLPPACFVGVAGGEARAQCIEAGKLWGIGAGGLVGILRAPAPK